MVVPNQDPLENLDDKPNNLLEVSDSQDPENESGSDDRSFNSPLKRHQEQASNIAEPHYAATKHKTAPFMSP
jgi:hypothetical protein